MTSSYGLGDGSWQLSISISDINVEKTLRVKGDLHVGGLMLRLVESIDVTRDWSDYAFWWPAKSLWLLRPRSTLDQYGVHADSHLEFTTMYKNVRVVLPDLQDVELRVDFSANVFSVVIKICKELGIRHPEELSLARRLEPEELKKNHGISATRRTRPAGLRTPSSSGSQHYLSVGSLIDSGRGSLRLRSPNKQTPSRFTSRESLMRTTSLSRSPYSSGLRSPYSPGFGFDANGTFSPSSVNSLFFGSISGPDSPLANSPLVTSEQAFQLLYRPSNLSEKARINAGWYDSSRSLMEQGVTEDSVLLLKYKFHAFYDLNPKYDAIRINQIYEQAKWSLLSEEVACSLDEMLMFAGLQLQIQIQSNQPQNLADVSETAEDHIDAALDELQRTLEGCVTSPDPRRSVHSDVTQIPQLADELRYLRPKKGFWWRSYKRFYFVFKDTSLLMYRNSSSTDVLSSLNIKGCDVSADVSVSSSKYVIKLLVPNNGTLSEVWLRTETQVQYARWMAAMKLACRGRTMADTAAFDSELSTITSLLQMQHYSRVPSSPDNQLSIHPQDFIAPRYALKQRPKHLIQRILDAHNNVCNLSLNDAKLNYIRAWQALPECGLTYFIVKFKGSRKEELLAVAYNRLLRMDLHSGDIIRTWRFPNMKSWSVNWEIRQVNVSFEEEDLAFQCLTADCKVVHEFLGGYIFLSMRSGDRNQTLNEELFHKLTGGWG